MKALRRSLKNTCGNVAVEFALVLPILFLLFTGLYELTTYILINNKLVRASATIGFIVAKEDLSRNRLVAYMHKAQNILHPFPYNGLGGMVISQISVDQNDRMFIGWQQSTGIGMSRIGSVGAAPSNLPNNLTIKGVERLIVSEAFYNYIPLISSVFLGPRQMYEITVQVPRSGTMDSLLQ